MPLGRQPRHEVRNKSDNRARHSLVRAERNPVTIKHQYLRREINAELAVQRLERTGMDGLLSAGAICIEQAHKETGRIESVSDWLARAQTNFTKVLTGPEPDKRLKPPYAEALLHQAQLSAHAAIAATGQLPTHNVATKTLDKTLDAAAEVADLFTESKSAGGRWTGEIAGVAGELSILLLGLRFATTSGIGSETWYPVSALFSNDRRNTHGSSVNHGWDIDILTDCGDGIEPTYKAQIKTTRSAARKDAQRRGHDQGIIPIYLNPDLQLSAAEYVTSCTILREYIAESTDPTPGVSEALDTRTDLLLALLEAD